MLPKGVTIERGNLDDGTVFDLGGEETMVVTIPGHSPGSVVFLDREGDTP